MNVSCCENRNVWKATTCWTLLKLLNYFMVLGCGEELIKTLLCKECADLCTDRWDSLCTSLCDSSQLLYSSISSFVISSDLLIKTEWLHYKSYCKTNFSVELSLTYYLFFLCIFLTLIRIKQDFIIFILDSPRLSGSDSKLGGMILLKCHRTSGLPNFTFFILI